MNTQIIVLCILSGIVTAYTWKENARRNRNPIERALWAFLFSLPLQVYVIYPLLDSFGLR